MIYAYECVAGHRRELMRSVDRRHDELMCIDCGLPMKLVISQIAKPVVWGTTHEASGGGAVAGGPREHARKLKESGRVDLSTETPESIRKMNEATRRENEVSQMKSLEQAVDRAAAEMGDALWTQ